MRLQKQAGIIMAVQLVLKIHWTFNMLSFMCTQPKTEVEFYQLKSLECIAIILY